MAGMTEPWQPPTELEQRLLDAKNADDKDAYLRLLAEADLFVPISKAEADEMVTGRREYFTLRKRTGFGRSQVDVFTRGGLTEPPVGDVFGWTSLGNLVIINSMWGTRYVINPGTPVEMLFAGKEFTRWLKRNPGIDRDTGGENALVTMRTMPQEGQLAQSLACGAHLAVANKTPWNSLDTTDMGYVEDAQALRRDWDVWDVADWRQTMESLLNEDEGISRSELVLLIRHQFAAQEEMTVSPDAWREAVQWWCRNNDIDDDDIPGLLEIVGRILRYEERFRADGVLPTDSYVPSMLAWDYGRAVNMVRWGLAAGYCDKTTAQQLILRAGGLCGKHYTSWIEFSAGYMLGRVLHFDSEEFGDWYTSVLAVHSILAEDPSSPWRTLSFIAAPTANPQ
jgi:hypothetical protein